MKRWTAVLLLTSVLVVPLLAEDTTAQLLKLLVSKQVISSAEAAQVFEGDGQPAERLVQFELIPKQTAQDIFIVLDHRRLFCSRLASSISPTFGASPALKMMSTSPGCTSRFNNAAVASRSPLCRASG